MEFRILGPLEAEGAAGPIELGGGKQRALLALLLLNANDVVPAGRLIDLLWSETPPARASKALHVLVSRLRSALAPEDVLQTRPGGYLLDVDPLDFDLRLFEERVAEGRRLLEDGDAAAAADVLADALELWRGAPLAEFAAEPFAQPEIARLEELRVATIEDRIDADLALGRHGTLVAELESLVARHPLRERLRTQLMLALYRCGRQADALGAYRDARRALVDELGIDPGRRLQELEQAILRQDPSLDPAATPAPSDVRPGRRAAGVFVGRKHELAELEAALDDAFAGRGRLYLISGETGIGKTRLADELASRAKEAGGQVLWGRCWKRGEAPAYWPWTQALRSLDEDFPSPEHVADEAERFRVFVEIAAALRRASERRPLLLVLDDVDDADDGSLVLLDFVAGELAEMHVALVVTYGEGADTPSAVAALGDHAAHHRLRLGPLASGDVAELLELAGASECDAEAVHSETRGNPRLVWQRVR